MRVHWREQPSSRVGLVRHAFQVCLTIGTLIALSACGGGGGGGGGDPSPGNPPSTPPPTNQAPTAVAGEDQTIDLATGSVTLAGSGTDTDAGDTLTYEWSASPAENVSFDDATSPTATVTFAAAGTYELTLTVNDGEARATDAVQITVTDEPVGGEPVVQAGEDQTIELPQNSVSLAGTATVDPATELTYSWTAEPAAGVTFADAAAASTTATFDAQGTYVLTLSASNGSATGSDSVQVIVEPAVYPGPDDDGEAHGWLTAAPADVGLDETLLAQARDYALTGGGSGAVVRRGRLVYTWGDIDELLDMKSTTKSIGGIALGLALEDSVVSSLTDTANTYLPAIGSPPHDPNDPSTDAITILQLATHTAGFDKPGGYSPLVVGPGTTFLYSDAGLNWLADTLTQAYQQDLSVLLNERVWAVLGIQVGDDLSWRANSLRPGPYPDGIERRELASGMNANANAMARVGLLFLRNGQWAGQAVVPQTFVDLVRTPRPEIAGLPSADPVAFPDATAKYGVLWWTNANGALPEVPTDAYWGWGLGDSLIVVIPSLDLVIARAGADPDVPENPRWRTGWNGDYAVLAPFLNPIVQSVQE